MRLLISLTKEKKTQLQKPSALFNSSKRAKEEAWEGGCSPLIAQPSPQASYYRPDTVISASY